MSQRKTLSKDPLTPQFTTNGLSYSDVIKFDNNNNNNFYFVNHDAPEAEQLQWELKIYNWLLLIALIGEKKKSRGEK